MFEFMTEPNEAGICLWFEGEEPKINMWSLNKATGDQMLLGAVYSENQVRTLCEVLGKKYKP